MSRLVAATNGRENYTVSPDGTMVYVAGDDGVMRAYTVSNGALFKSWNVGNDLAGIAISPDGTQALVTEDVPVSTSQTSDWTSNTTQAAVYQIDLKSGYRQTYIYDGKGSDYTFVNVAFADNGHALISENILPGWSGWEPIMALDLDAGTFSAHGSFYSGLGSTPSLTRIPGTNTILVGQLGLSSADYFVLDGTGSSVHATSTYEHGVQGYAGGIEAVSGPGKDGRVAIVTGGGLYIYDGTLNYIDNLAVRFPTLGNSPAVTFDATGKVLYAVDATSHQIIGISMTTFVETQRIDFGDYTPATLAAGEELRLLPGGVRFLMATTTGVIEIDRPTANVPTDGNDVLIGTAGDDTFGGGSGNDRISGLGGKDTLYGDIGKDQLNGGAGDDRLSGGAGNDKLLGGYGNDLLVGGIGQDTLAGSGGHDVFRFAPGDSARIRTNADIITDFSHAEIDQIDLSAFDTNAARGGIQPFLFIGTAAFTPGGGKLAGELHYVHADGYTYIEGDANKDGVADVVIALKGTLDLVASDFIL